MAPVVENPVDLSIVVPAFNEASRLPKTAPPAIKYLCQQDYRWEIILVDDGSDDKTALVAEEVFCDNELLVIKNGSNRGKGFSVGRGVLAARGRVVLISDADFSSPMQELEKLRSAINEGFDLAIGSRSLPDSNITERQAWIREYMGRTFNLLVQLIVLPGFIDTQCGFKLFPRDVGVSLFSKMKVDRFAFDVELLYLARKQNLKIKEVPVEWRNIRESRVNIIKDSFRMLIDLFRIRLNDLTNKYS